MSEFAKAALLTLWWTGVTLVLIIAWRRLVPKPMSKGRQSERLAAAMTPIRTR
jgi:hypothetical protein